MHDCAEVLLAENVLIKARMKTEEEEKKLAREYAIVLNEDNLRIEA